MKRGRTESRNEETGIARKRTKVCREREPFPLVDLGLYNVGEPGRKPPRWIKEEPIVTVGAWEPLFHRRRSGISNWVDGEETFARVSYFHV